MIEMNAKIFEIAANGEIFGKEYSGCEFYVSVSEVIDWEWM